MKSYYDLGEEFYDKEDYASAVDCYQKGAAAGEVECVNALGYCYEHGVVVEKSGLKALEYYKQAAETGFLKGIMNVASSYGTGMSGVPKDQEKSFAWYMKAAELDDMEAQYLIGQRYRLGVGVEQDWEKSLEWYEKSAEKGFLKAAWTLSQIYEWEQDGLEDKEKARYWCRKAAELGYVDAQAKLGYDLAHEGQHEEAVIWYEKAAEQGHPESKANLGYCYLYGNGVKKDKKKARELILNSGMSFMMIPDALYDDEE